MRRWNWIRLAAASFAACAGARADALPAVVCTQIPTGGQGGRLVLRQPGGATRVLTQGFESAADPEVSFDGTRILFAGRRQPGDRWTIFEMNLDGSGVRQITRCTGNCRSPVYQPPIFYLDDPAPVPQIAFVSDEPATFGEHGGGRVTHLYSARLDGSGVRRLTYNPSGALDPAMLPDGRMLFSAWRTRMSPAAEPRLDLFGVNIDGTDFAAFSGGQGSRLKRMACVTPARQVVLVDSDADSRDGSGPLAVIDLRRNLHSWRRVTAPSEGLFHSPSPLPFGGVLAARRPTGVRGTYGIVRLDMATGAVDPVFDTPGNDEIQPRAVAPRAVPDGRSSVVDEKQPWAKLYCLSVYDSDVEPKLWPKGSIGRIRVLEGIPHTSPQAGPKILRKRFVGETDVDEDGSFHLEIPANTPVQIQALDGNGMALRTCAWIWAKNREQRGCIGCHEDGERTPENVMASALTRPAVNLMLPPDRRRTVEFRDVSPILMRSCSTAQCHFKTRFNDPRYVTRGSARSSRLAWAALGKHKLIPPATAPALTEPEKRAIIEWIDLGAQ